MLQHFAGDVVRCCLMLSLMVVFGSSSWALADENTYPVHSVSFAALEQVGHTDKSDGTIRYPEMQHKELDHDDEMRYADRRVQATGYRQHWCDFYRKLSSGLVLLIQCMRNTTFTCQIVQTANNTYNSATSLNNGGVRCPCTVNFYCFIILASVCTRKAVVMSRCHFLSIRCRCRCRCFLISVVVVDVDFCISLFLCRFSPFR